MRVKGLIRFVVFAIVLYFPHHLEADVVMPVISACSGKKASQKCKIDYSGGLSGWKNRKSVSGRCHSLAELRGETHEIAKTLFSREVFADRGSFRLRCMTKKDLRETRKRLRKMKRFKKRIRRKEASIATHQPDVGQKIDVRSDYPQQESETTIEDNEIDELEFVPDPIEEVPAEDSTHAMAWGTSALSVLVGGILLIAIRRNGRRFETG